MASSSAPKPMLWVKGKRLCTFCMYPQISYDPTPLFIA